VEPQRHRDTETQRHRGDKGESKKTLEDRRTDVRRSPITHPAFCLLCVSVPLWLDALELAMPDPVGFYTDTTVCIGCKACQVACHEWNSLPAGKGQRTPLPLLSGNSYDNTGS